MFRFNFGLLQCIYIYISVLLLYLICLVLACETPDNVSSVRHVPVTTVEHLQ